MGSVSDAKLKKKLLNVNKGSRNFNTIYSGKEDNDFAINKERAH